jgi:hypothetical protein
MEFLLSMPMWQWHGKFAELAFRSRSLFTFTAVDERFTVVGLTAGKTQALNLDI